RIECPSPTSPHSPGVFAGLLRTCSMAGKVKTRRQVRLPVPDVAPVRNASFKADAPSAEVITASAFRLWWTRVVLKLRPRQGDAVRSRTLRASAPANVSSTAQTVFALYRAAGCTRAMPQNESVGRDLPARLRSRMQRTARRLLEAATGRGHHRH